MLIHHKKRSNFTRLNALFYVRTCLHCNSVTFSVVSWCCVMTLWCHELWVQRAKHAYHLIINTLFYLPLCTTSQSAFLLVSMAMASTFLSNNSLGSGLNTKATTSSSWPLHQQRSQVSGGVRRRHSLHRSLLISCKGGRDADNAVPFIDRRNVLIGLGGLYGAASSIGFDAVAAPIAPPDLSKCGPADLPAGAIPTNCCPPFNDKIVDFKFPSFTKMRVRPAAHSAADDKEYMAKFTKAIQLMKDLPKDDPRNFTQQANVHCAYCDGTEKL